VAFTSRGISFYEPWNTVVIREKELFNKNSLLRNPFAFRILKIQCPGISRHSML
jgi:hypothetical protein